MSPVCQRLHKPRNTQVSSPTHIRRVRVEQVVSHTQQGLVQLVSESGDGSELAAGWSHVYRLVGPPIC